MVEQEKESTSEYNRPRSDNSMLPPAIYRAATILAIA